MAKRKDLNGFVPAPLVGVSTTCPTDEECAGAYPEVYSCLMPHWCEGKLTRQSGTLRIRIVGAYYVVTLCCPTEGLETDLTTSTLCNLFEQLQGHLTSGKAVWRPTWEARKKAGQPKA